MEIFEQVEGCVTIYDGERKVATLVDATSHAELKFHTGEGYYWLKDVETALRYLKWKLNDMRVED